MKKDDVDSMLSRMNVPRPGDMSHKEELKIPLFSYKRSSHAGLWLLSVPASFVVVVLLKYRLGLHSPILDTVESMFNAISDNAVLTYLIPVIFIGLPLVALVINFLAFCYATSDMAARELLVTIKYRPLNIAIFLLSFAALVYFFLPDVLP